MSSPIGIVHTNGFLALQDPRLVRHHTRLMQRRLSVQDQHITVPQMPMDLLIDRRRPRRKTEARSGVSATLWRQELICDGRSLLRRQFVLHIVRYIALAFWLISNIRGRGERGKTYEELLAAVFVLYYRSSWVDLGPVDDELSHLVDVSSGDRFGEGQFSSEHRWDTDLVWLDIDVRRDDGSSGVVYSFTLQVDIIEAIRSPQI